MAVQIDSDISGVDELQRKMELLDTKMQIAIHERFQAEANLIKATAQSYAPVRTGFLRSTIYVVVTGLMHVKIGAWAHYAKYQEFGTRRTHGIHFLSRAFQEHWSRFRQAIDYVVDKVIGEVAAT